MTRRLSRAFYSVPWRNVCVAVRLLGDECGWQPKGLDAQATTAWPGSKEKLAVLADRIQRGVELWHPEDGGEE